MVMLLMGLTLNKEEIISAIKNWKVALLGTVLQFLLMPLIAYILGMVFNLSPEMKLGLILVGACPGGTASNVIVYLFKGDVSLSVFMTFLSTVSSVILTPLLLQFYAGSYMEVPTNKMIGDIFVLVLLPLVVGYFLQRALKSECVLKLEKTSSIIAAIVIALIIATIVAANAKTIATVSAMLFVVVFLHNGFGLLFGYLISYYFVRDKKIARTIAIEVGMQNSGLGVVLANVHFTKIVALPAAVFSFWHNISGMALANYWKRSR
jgi:BASS family bile acid:Na+ symporter